MVTELPVGGGDRGGFGGNSVGVIWGVPDRGVLVLVGAAVAKPVACGVNVVTGGLVARKVGVEGPGYPGGVFVTTGPGYPGEVLVTKGPGYCWLVGGICGPGYAGVNPVVGLGLLATTVGISVTVADGKIVSEAWGITGCVLVFNGAGYGVGLENGTSVCPGGCG